MHIVISHIYLCVNNKQKYYHNINMIKDLD